MHLNVAPLICSLLAPLNITPIVTGFAVFCAEALLYSAPALIVFPMCSSPTFTTCDVVDPGLLNASISVLMYKLDAVTLEYAIVLEPKLHL